MLDVSRGPSKKANRAENIPVLNGPLVDLKKVISIVCVFQ